MGVSDWFKRKRAPEAKGPPAIPRPDEFITVYDERGRELKVKRADWVSNVLMPAIENAWNDPKELSSQIVQALQDDFVEQVAEAAERLVELDRESENALVLVAVVRMEKEDFAGATRALERSIAKHGPSGIVLTNLAKVLERRGDVPASRATLKRGLELDPNQDNGLLWWAALAREEKGEAGYLAALTEIAQGPGAWRPQLWLARSKLKQGQRADALRLYDEVLAKADRSADVLMMVTGDLGNAGALDELVRLTAERYAPEIHGPPAGFNLIQAYKQLGRSVEALALIRKLQAMGWAPFAASLAALETEIVAATPRGEVSAPKVSALVFDEPLWTRGLFEPDWLLPSRGEGDPFVGLCTFANETIRADAPRLQSADPLGRLTRALPLYLAEMLRLRFRLRARAVILATHHGPAVFGQQLGRDTVDGMLSEVMGHRLAIAGSLIESGVKLEIWKVGGSEASTSVSVAVPLTDVTLVVTSVERALLDGLKSLATLTEAPLPPSYEAPPHDLLAGYASALEQLLFQMMAANAIVLPDSIWNERGYFETYFGLNDAWPSAPDSARLIAVAGTLAATKYQSRGVEPYRKACLGWLDAAPAEGSLGKLAPAIFKRLGERERFARSLGRAASVADARYQVWLERVKAEPWPV